MRKMFRMKYESCTGQCYAYSDVMRIRTLGLDMEGAVAFLKRLVAMHGPSCGNPHLAFRLDVDEELDVFVASFERYGSLDLFCDRTALGAMNKLIDAALAYYQSEEFKALRQTDQKYGALAMQRPFICKHGTDNKLIEFAIAFSGLSTNQQDALRAEFV